MSFPNGEQRGYDPTAHVPQAEVPFPLSHEQGFVQPQPEQSRGLVARVREKITGRGRGSERPYAATDPGRLDRARQEAHRWTEVARQHAPDAHERYVRARDAARDVGSQIWHDPGGRLLDAVDASQQMAEEADEKNAQRNWVQRTTGSVGGKLASGAVDMVWSAGTVYSPVDIVNAASGIKAMINGKDVYGKHQDKIAIASHLVGAAIPWVPSTAVIEGTAAVRNWLHKKNAAHGDRLRSINQSVLDARHSSQPALPQAPHEIRPHGEPPQFGPPQKR